MAGKSHEIIEGDYTIGHRLLIKKRLSGQEADVLMKRLLALNGVIDVKMTPDSARVAVRYDARKIDFERIATLLNELGYPLSSGWLSRLKRSWFRYQDTNIKESSGASDGSCCSNPSNVYASRTQRH